MRLCVLTFALACVLLAIACDDPKTPEPGCEAVPDRMIRFLYWGESETGESVPNRGVAVSYVRLPRWLGDNRLLAYSAGSFGSQVTQGLFDITGSGDPLRFGDFVAHDAGIVWSLATNIAAGEFVVSILDSLGSTVLVGTVGPGTVALVDTLVHRDELPTGVAYAGVGADVIYYSLDAGEFRLLSGGVSQTLLSTPLTPEASRWFVVSDSALYYARQAGPTGFELHRYHLPSARDTVLVNLPGRVGGIAANPDPTFPVMVVRNVTSSATPLQSRSYLTRVRTDGTYASVSLAADQGLCYGYEAADPSVSPDGRYVALAMRRVVADGFKLQWELWLREIR
jgi:hypothetical protein